MKVRRLIRYIFMFCMIMGVMLSATVTVEAGTWQKNRVGWWWQEDNGNYPINQWRYINGKWYSFDQKGYMRFGWYWDGRNWYYLGSVNDGSMKTSWQKVNGKWYYMYSNGKMAFNCWIGPWYVNASGAWVENAKPDQWIKSKNRWWYRHTDGSYTVDGWETINGRKYHFDSAGWMQSGWQVIDKNWYYLGNSNDGSMKTSQWIDGYYVGTDGKMVTRQWIDGYYLDATGKIAKNQWIGEFYVGDDGKKITGCWIGDSYVGSDGNKVFEQWVGDYYIGSEGVKLKEQWVGDKYVGEDGKWIPEKKQGIPLESIVITDERGNEYGENNILCMSVGSQHNFGVAYYPANTTEDRTIEWTSGNENVVTIENGKIKIHAIGQTEITARVGEHTSTLEIQASPNSNLQLSIPNYYYMNKGDTIKPTVTVYGEEYKDLVWSSSNENVLQIDDNGVFHAKESGMSYVTTKITNGYPVTCWITVFHSRLESISLDKENLTLSLDKRKTAKLSVTTVPENFPDIRYGSLDQNVVRVDSDGNVTAVGIGTTTVYADVTSCGKRATCLVTVQYDGEIEYSSDEKLARDIFDKVNEVRASNGVPQLEWCENGMARASQLVAGYSVMENTWSTEQYGELSSTWTYRMPEIHSADEIINLWKQNLYVYRQMLRTYPGFTSGGCGCVIQKVDGKVVNVAIVFTMGCSEETFNQHYSTQELADGYWAETLQIPAEKFEKYLFQKNL